MSEIKVIKVRELVKNYGKIRAADGVSFDVQEGEIFGMIGPNGAGKTTIIECIEGLKKPDSGIIEVLGMNPASDRKALYRHIGVQLQEASYPDNVKVEEICRLFSSFYEKPLPYEELLKRFELYEHRKAYISKLSGGQKQRLSIILALILDPQIVFLDELTTGLDPHARRAMWELVKGLKQQGITVFMTTHYMEEAEYLCDRVAVVELGKIIAMDTVANLVKANSGQEIISFTAAGINLQMLNNLQGVQEVRANNDEITILGTGSKLLNNLLNFLQEQGIAYRDLKTKSPNLEDVFLKLTGHSINHSINNSVEEKLK
jgi:ABC-2 type transport system ATP-binding protein